MRAMPLRVSRPLPAVIRIDARWPLAARLFGLPFLGTGGWLLFQVLAGVWEARVDGAGSVVAGLASVLVGAFVALLFLVPGMLLTLTRKWVEVDGGRRALRETTNFAGWPHSRVRSLSGASAVASRRRAPSNSSRHWFPQVEIVLEGGTREDLPPGDTDDEINQLGQSVAALLGVPFRNELHVVDRNPAGA